MATTALSKVFAGIRALQLVDRRVVYLLLVLVLSVPFVLPYSLPVYPDTYTRQFFDQIETIANDPALRDKVVLVLSNWGPGTAGENEPQFRIVLRHLLRRRLPFVFICSTADPTVHDAAMLSFKGAQADEVQRARQRGTPRPSWTYGEDYLDFGFINAPVFASQARAILVDTRNAFARDFVYQRPLADDASFPLLRRFRGIRDLSAVLTLSAGDEGKYIAGLVQTEYPELKIGVATMGIVANDLYPYVKSGQLFGLLNSQRAATEYRVLLNPEEKTSATDNAMSLGKSLLLLLVLMGNVAYLAMRWAERSGRLAPLDPRQLRPPLPPLPRRVMVALFAVFVLCFGGTVAGEVYRFATTHTLPRPRAARPDDTPGAAYPAHERVGPADLLAAAQADVARHPALERFVQQEAELRWHRMIETRVGDFIMAFLTLGVFAFLLGDNPFYRFIEGIIIGGALAYGLVAIDKVLVAQWWQPIAAACSGQRSWAHALWLLLLIPGALWYFTYSRRYRWVNQVLVAVFIGLMIGPEFENQTSLLIPQVLDTVQPIWPWAANAQSGALEFRPSRVEHLVFVLTAVLSLVYFILFFRPKTRAGRGTLAAGRLVMMVGFGAMFGNTVNTRLSWLAPRVGVLIHDWLGKLLGS